MNYYWCVLHSFNYICQFFINRSRNIKILKMAFNNIYSKQAWALTAFFIFSTYLYAQKEYPKKYFRPPIDFKIQIAGNFGELRSNHFHTGLDILTQGVEGKKVYAVADGYVSRINISGSGYGNALYVTHPNGYVSVFGHLKTFNSKISSFLDSAQHAKQQFALNLYPLPGRFPVKKGEVLAFSGNSGSSSGPHIHFEIRDRETEEPLNPLLFGIAVKDDVRPKIFSVSRYSFSDSLDWDSFSKTEYKYINGKTIRANGNTGFGIELFDYTTGRRNTNGVYNLKLKIDDSLYFESQFDRLSFYTNRYINSYIDYGERISTRKKIVKCFIEPNNRLGNYLIKDKNGIFDFNDGKTHKIKITATDFYGNSTSVSFRVKADSSYKKRKDYTSKYFKQKLFYQKENYFEGDGIKISFHRNSLLYNVNFQYYTSTPKANTYSKVHHIHKESTPLFNKITIALKVDSAGLPLNEKLLVARLTRDGHYQAEGGKLVDNYLVTKINSFGDFVVLADTIKPVIKPLYYKKKLVSSHKNLRFKIYDDLSGVKNYRGCVDGKWILFKYDTKYHLLKCDLLKEGIKAGKHELALKLTDYCGNSAVFKSKFSL